MTESRDGTDSSQDPGTVADALLFDILAADEAHPDRLRHLRDCHADLAPEVERRLVWLQRVGFLDEPRPDAAAITMRVPGFQILRLLGQGGMGTVHLAWQQSLNRSA